MMGPRTGIRFENVALESIRMELPEEIWTSEAIEMRMEAVYRKINVSVGRLELMTGIRERRVWEEPFLPSKEAANVAHKLLTDSALPKEGIDLLIHAGVCRDRLEPATAAYVHQSLSLPQTVQFMDISNACLGFLNAMIVAASMIEGGLIRSALIVTAENSRSLIENTIASISLPGMSRKEMKKYFANLTIGSGAVAALLCHRRFAPDAPRMIGGVIRADSSHNALCEGGSGGGHEMLTDSEALLHAGINLAKATWADFRNLIGWTDEKVDHYICHQVGKMHQNALYDGLKIDRSKDYSTYQTLGNMGSAALPGTLAHAIMNGVLQKGEHSALLGIGSGLSSVMLGIES
jgi:acyl-CoA:acyl-CoA alkyltransferase